MKNRCASQPQSEDPNPGMGTETLGILGLHDADVLM